MFVANTDVLYFSGRSRSPSVGPYVDIAIRSRSGSFNLPPRLGSASPAPFPHHRRDSSLALPDNGANEPSSSQQGPGSDNKSDVQNSQATEGETQRAARLDQETA